jgi:hypothetical protein
MLIPATGLRPMCAQRPKQRNFERNSYKMALKIALAKKFIAKCSARIAPGYWGKKLYKFHYMYSKYLSYKRKISSIREIETFSL